MNNSVLVSSHTSSSTPPSTALDLGLVLGPHSDPRSWFETWIQPWLGIIGMADNLVCVIIFGPILSGWCACGSGRGVHVKGGGVSLVSRIYYVVISVAELFNVGAGYILRNTITYLPFALSNGTVLLLVMRAGMWGCKLDATVWIAAGYASSWTMVCLAFERLLAVYWPLRVKSLLGLRFTLLLLCLPAFVTVLYLVLIIFMYRAFPLPPPLADVCYGDFTLPSFIYYVVFNECNSITCSTLNISFSVAVAIRLLRIRHERRSMQEVKSKEGLGRKEINAAITMIALIVSYEVFIIPWAGSWAVYYALAYTTPTSSLLGPISEVGFWVQEFVLVGCALHFFVYVLRVRAFREAFFCGLLSRDRATTMTTSQ